LINDAFFSDYGIILAERQDALLLGSRDFSGDDVPPRSKMGNRITSFVFLAFCGLRIHDTQTGLRAIPAGFLRDLPAIKGDRYEYETNMLLEAKRLGMDMKEVSISTVYLDNNSASHFNAVKDSFRIYSLIFKYIFSSACASLTDLLAFYLIIKFFGNAFGVLDVLISTVLARVISSLVNYTVNRNVVFNGGKNAGHTLLRYYALAIPVMLSSVGLVSLLKYLFGSEYAILTTLIKMIVDTFLFFLTFRIQREWVFRKK